MDPPKTVSDLAIWVAIQFPVLAAVVLVARWVLRWSNQQRVEEIKRIEDQYTKLLSEKDQRLIELKAEKDKRIEELTRELRELKEKHTRSRKPRDEGASEDEGDNP